MTNGTNVVRVSLRSDEGTIGEVGKIARVYTDTDGAVFGYIVVWDAMPKRGQYVAPVRIRSLEEWEAEKRSRPVMV